MKIAIIHSIYKPHVRGGAEVVVETIAKTFQKRSNDVFVISVGRKNKTEEIDGVTVYRIKPFNVFNFLDINKKSIPLRFIWHIFDTVNDVQTFRIFKVLMREKPDLVLTHNLKGLGYYTPWLLKVLKIKHVHTIHDMQLIHPSGLLGTDLKIGMLTALYMRLSRWLFRHVKTVVFPSEYIKSVYEGYGFFKQAHKVVLGNPVIMHGLVKHDSEDCKVPQLLFLGQVEEYKGIFDLLEAVKDININFNLHIVGDGLDLERAKKIVSGDKRIKFYGQLTQKEIAHDIWPRVNLLINPTKTPESFGMVVMEACSYGIPSISANIGAISELVIEGKTGWLFESGNVSDLKDTIKTITSRLCTFGAIGMLCQEKVKEFDVGNYLNKLIESAKINEN